jgi:hypothetical protein
MSYTSVLVVSGHGLIMYLSACLRLCDVFLDQACACCLEYIWKMMTLITQMNARLCVPLLFRVAVLFINLVL